MSPEAVRQERVILEERARRLARPRDVGHERPATPYLAFGIGAEEYAVAANEVEGVFRLRLLTPLPGAPEQVAGVTSWRGRVLTVLDVEKVLGIARTGLDDRAWVVGLGVGRIRVGLIASKIGTIVDVDVDTIHPLERGRPSAVVGRAGHALLVLDGHQLATAVPQGENS